MPASLPQGGVYPAAATDARDITKVGWRDFFVDDRLRTVIQHGLNNNQDLALAAANVLQARAQYRVSRADLVPSTIASGSATYTNNVFGASGATSGPGTGSGTGVGTGTGGAGSVGGSVGTGSSNLEFYSANVGFSAFELDLFGRVRNQNKAALEQYFATEEAQRSTRISLIAEIATAWLTIAQDEDQLALSQQTLQTFKQTLDLTTAQFRIGVASELESRQAETNYQAARNDIAVLRTQIARDRNALDLLVGQPVETALLPTALGDARAAIEVLPTDLSSTALLRRPDVLQAEHQLIAQNANIGAARAAFFPTISLTATLGTISTALGGLFGSGTGTYTGSPAVSLPLFDGGRNKGNPGLCPRVAAGGGRDLSEDDPDRVSRGRRRAGAARHDQRTDRRANRARERGADRGQAIGCTLSRGRRFLPDLARCAAHRLCRAAATGDDPIQSRRQSGRALPLARRRAGVSGTRRRLPAARIGVPCQKTTRREIDGIGATARIGSPRHGLEPAIPARKA